MKKALLLGATGFIGGELLYQLAQDMDLDIELTCLIRDERKAPLVKAIHPHTRIVIGDLDHIEVLSREVANSDVILSIASTVHAVATLAIAEALEKRSKRTDSPAYWIQMSGGSVFIADQMKAQRFGIANDEVHDDLKDAKRTIEIINGNPAKLSEQIVFRQHSAVARTALVMGPHVYGRGRGPWYQRTVQCNEIARATLKLGHGFRLNKGQNAWSDVHVADFAELICLLLKAALEGENHGLWNEDGIYHPENGNMAFGDLCALIAKEAASQGLILPPDAIRTVTPAEANGLSNHADILWGAHVVMTSSRCREKLGWTPKRHSLRDELPMMVRQEARFLGMLRPR